MCSGFFQEVKLREEDDADIMFHVRWNNVYPMYSYLGEGVTAQTTPQRCGNVRRATTAARSRWSSRRWAGWTTEASTSRCRILETKAWRSCERSAERHSQREVSLLVTFRLFQAHLRNLGSARPTNWQRCRLKAQRKQQGEAWARQSASSYGRIWRGRRCSWTEPSTLSGSSKEVCNRRLAYNCKL